ncbi:MAG: MBL fold metallo-hydrolase [Oscillospiraceae bacterium]|nr:MBL fold metallo-hydrolase [Oscillospiraceae bacterium]
MNFVYSLCSSSSGNSTFIGNKKNGILLDAGIGPRNLKTQLGLADVSPCAVRAVFLTHEHTDHISGLRSFVEKHDVPVFGTIGTLERVLEKDAVAEKTKLYEINRKKALVGDLEIEAFRTSHDSAESIGIRVRFPDGKTAGFCTDLGRVTDNAAKMLSGCDFVMIESNYDEEMLENGSYPYILKKRIKSEAGHLSNSDCSSELIRLLESGSCRFMLAHLSVENNTPEIAMRSAAVRLDSYGARIGQDYELNVAPRMGAGKIIEL